MYCFMYKQLSREQRYAIYLGLQEKKTYTAIARQIGVSISTVRQNANRHGRYIFTQACELTQVRRERTCVNRRLKRHVIDEALSLLVGKRWSPEQISEHLKRKGVSISHEKIYSLIRADTTGELKKSTRHGMKYRRRTKSGKATKIPYRTSIHLRLPEADGSRFGDWEMDLVVGKGQRSALVTLTERSTNYLIMAFVPNKKPSVVANAVWKSLCPFIGSIKTITTDNGFEFRDHRTIARRLKTTVYFANPYSSWQKGAIENANKLIRQYFPKGTDFNLIPEGEIKRVQAQINERPRKKLNFENPKMRFYKLCT